MQVVFFFQAEDGIRDAQESRGLGDVYKRQKLPSDAGICVMEVAFSRKRRSLSARSSHSSRLSVAMVLP